MELKLDNQKVLEALLWNMFVTHYMSHGWAKNKKNFYIWLFRCGYIEKEQYELLMETFENERVR